MVIGVILGIVFALLAIVAGAFAYGSFESDSTAGGVIGVVLCIALVAAFLIVPFSFHTVDTGEIAVVKNFGKIKDVKTSGMHYDFWMTSKYDRYDTKVQNVDIETMAYSSDAQTMNVLMTLQYNIIPDKVTNIASQYGSLKILESRIQSVAIEKTKAVLSAYKAMDIIADRASISPAVEAAIKDAIGEEYYVNVATVVLTNIDFSDAFEQAVEDKMIAEQAKLKADYENETKIAKAEADAAAKLKEAEAEIDIAKAKAEALKISAEAEAEANRIIAESLTDEIIEKILADSWDGELPDVVGSGDYILPSDIFDKE